MSLTELLDSNPVFDYQRAAIASMELQALRQSIGQPISRTKLTEAIQPEQPTTTIICTTKDVVILETPTEITVLQLEYVTSIRKTSNWLYICRPEGKLQLPLSETLFDQLTAALIAHYTSKEPLCL